jgi:tRNA nucleotidyltransferase (CCA-adding enzyme)
LRKQYFHSYYACFLRKITGQKICGEAMRVYRLPEAVREILEKLENAGYEAWCVGGAVRDLLLGREPGDWDAASSAPPEAVLNLFGADALPTGLRHGTVTVKTAGGRGVEVTTFRCDGTYSDRRRPDRVTFTSSLEEDLARRDFTVNAIALSRRGELADPFGGRADLAGRVLRAVGEPERRFGEDALRILRGLRFASRLGFALETGTAAALRRCAPLLGEIAPERVREELTGILCGEHVLEVLLAYPDVLGAVLPEILPCVGFDQHSVYHCYDVWEHTARAAAAVPPVPVLRWAMLLHDLGKPDAFFLDAEGRGHFHGHWRKSVEHSRAILDRLRFDNHSRQTILTLVERHDCELPLSEKSVRRNLARYGEEALRLLLEVKRADNLAQAEQYRDRQVLIRQWEELLAMVLAEGGCFSLRQLAVRGGDMTGLGLRGPAVGRALEELLDLVMDEKLPNDRAILLDYTKEKLL